MPIGGISSSSAAMQGNQDTLKTLKQQKTALEMQIAQLQSKDAETNADAIEKLQKQLAELEKQILQLQNSSRANQVTNADAESSSAALEEKIGPAYQVDISNEAMSLQAAEEEKNQELAKSDEEKMLEEKNL